MAEAVRMNAARTKPMKSTPLMKRVTSYVLLALVFFLLGFLPSWAAARDASSQLSETESALRLLQMQTALGTAVIDAQQGDYEPALQSVSQFYASVQAELNRGDTSAFS